MVFMSNDKRCQLASSEDSLFCKLTTWSEIEYEILCEILEAEWDMGHQMHIKAPSAQSVRQFTCDLLFPRDD